MRRPRATLMSQAPGFIAARVSASIMSSVSGVSGARGRRSPTRRGARQRLGAADAIEHRPRRTSILAHPARRRRSATSRPASPGRDDPAAEGRRERADGPPDRAEPDDADRHVAQLAALERLPGPLALELEQLRQPPADREDHHQHVLGDRPREDAARVRDDEAALARGRRQHPLDAGGRGVDPRSRGARARSRSNASAESQPRSSTSTSSSGSSASPSTRQRDEPRRRAPPRGSARGRAAR